ncbi:GyrI-like domain-containing protein [Bacillus sp. AGMB 02131]|uniref:GyrI-like domain-containing protein n=1 Tax=Peribacillus faecalis TaxID=2772559 RepID=A0A927CWM1_9BACI|nr:GyrI-like domain-containing protein [Peribacillus faecalis]MBD3108916.1 GyrI-like domain-containing protein [Peribacillus faecalis]
MNMRVEKMPKCRIAYVRQVGPYGEGNVQAMEKIKKWAREKQLMADGVILGIALDNPETTAPENCRYDACVVIPYNFAADDSFCEAELAGGEYAVCKVKHTSQDIQRAWAEIFPALNAIGYQIADRPIIERYKEEMVTNGYCELCVPVKMLL